MDHSEPDDRTIVSLPGNPPLSASACCPKCGLLVPPDTLVCPQDGTFITESLGTHMSDKYELISVSGAGGMSIIYKAIERTTGKVVAIKMLNSLLMNEIALRRFQLEAKAITSLVHPNIISVHDFGVSETGHPYMVMDFVQGKNLAELIKEKGALSLEESLPRFLQICDALDHAHQKGVLHRDIKPSNIMVSSEDGSFEDARIVDFGIAKIIQKDQTEPAATLTQTGELFGSPPYMSPEQCRGTNVDKRSDIYSVGCVMFETLTGQQPLRGATIVETLMMHISQTPPSLIQVCPTGQFSPILENVIAKCLSKDPADRFQSMDQLKFRLMQLNSGTTDERIYQPRKKFKIQKSLLIGVGCFLLGAFLPVCLIVYVVQAALYRDIVSISGNRSQRSFQGSTRSTATNPSNTPPASSTQGRSTPTGHFAPPVESGDEKLKNEAVADYCLDARNRQQKSLNLAHKIFIDDSGLVNIGKMKLLEELAIDNTMVTDKSMPAIASLSKLQVLSLGGSMVTDAGVKKVRALQNLRALKLAHSDITDASMLTVGSLKLLDEVALEDTAITDKGVACLAGLRLKQLSLGHTKISDASMNVIGNMTSLVALKLNDTDIGDTGLAQLKKLKNLQLLDLDRTRCSDKGLSFLQSMKDLVALQASCKNITNGGIKYLQKLPVMLLDLSGCSITDKGLPEIAKIKTLRELRLASTQITDAGLVELANMRNIQVLDLGSTKITSEGIKVLGKMKGTLKKVVISQCPGVRGSNNKMRADLKTTIIYFSQY